MVVVGGRAQTLEDGKREYHRTIQSDAAAEKMRQIIRSQGGDPAVVDEPGRLPQARHRTEWQSPEA
ncbi:MAG: hypothetical protein AAB289_12555, partial [Chloroflexota bacterium]